MLKIIICDCMETNCSQLADDLKTEYVVRHAFTPDECENTILEFSPDIILCGREFGGLYVSDLVRVVRRLTEAPIILIRSLESLSPLPIKAFGLADFICAPINHAELSARISLALSEFVPPESPKNYSGFKNGKLSIDYATCRVFIGDEQIHLTLLEYKLLCLLSKNCGCVVKYSAILDELWANPIGNEILSLRVFVAALRKKLQSASPDEVYLQTHMGEGYCMPRIDGSEE